MSKPAMDISYRKRRTLNGMVNRIETICGGQEKTPIDPRLVKWYQEELEEHCKQLNVLREVVREQCDDAEFERQQAEFDQLAARIESLQRKLREPRNLIHNDVAASSTPSVALPQLEVGNAVREHRIPEHENSSRDSLEEKTHCGVNLSQLEGAELEEAPCSKASSEEETHSEEHIFATNFRDEPDVFAPKIERVAPQTSHLAAKQPSEQVEPQEQQQHTVRSPPSIDHLLKPIYKASPTTVLVTQQPLASDHEYDQAEVVAVALQDGSISDAAQKMGILREQFTVFHGRRGPQLRESVSSPKEVTSRGICSSENRDDPLWRTPGSAEWLQLEMIERKLSLDDVRVQAFEDEQDCDTHFVLSCLRPDGPTSDRLFLFLPCL